MTMIPLLLSIAVPMMVPATQGPGAAQGPGVRVATDCATCHSNASTAVAMRDEEGRPIAPFDLWSSTMMANSARDPLWRAFVSAEVAASPSQREHIESTCLRCHAPMAHAVGLEEHGTGSLMHVLDCDSELGDVARDGVSCTICHGISPAGLGTPASFSGHFELDRERRLFGPHTDPFPNPMRPFTGFTPTHGEHILDASLCGSCHTLETETLDANEQPTGDHFLEQAIFLEWRNSSFGREQRTSCQDCHVPPRDVDGRTIHTTIARNPRGLDFPATEPRSPFGRHVLVGGNTLIPAILRDHREELGVQATDAALEATLAAAREQLETRTASIMVTDLEREGDLLSFRVLARNHAGHKLPTGHPTRRAWLRVEVRDASGRTLFASGRADDQGRIVDGSGEVLPSELAGGPSPDHRDEVRRSDEVATYEATMADVDGNPTYLLTRAASWLVDDRILPMGWDGDDPEADRTAPVGIGADEDFLPGKDSVRYVVEVPAGAELELEVALLYQTLGARWAAELFLHDTPEVLAFRRMYEAADRVPVVLDSERVEL